MENKFNKKVAYPLILSFGLLISIFYFATNKNLLAASVSPEGNMASMPISGNGEVVLQPPSQNTTSTGNSEVTTGQRQAIEATEEDEIPKDIYIVKAGQTLWEIAQETGLPIKTLMNENQLSNSFIIEGQELSYNK